MAAPASLVREIFIKQQESPMTTYTLTEAQRQQLLDVSLAGVSKANTLATKMLQSLTPNGGKAVAWQCKELGGEFWQDCNKERAGVRAAKPDKWEVRELFTHPAPSTSPIPR